MGIKNHTRCWKRGNKNWPSIYGVKGPYALDLLMLEQIKIGDKDYKRLLDTNRLNQEKMAIAILESKGWRWCKYDADTKYRNS